jgi:hypothetical protein
MMSEMWNENKYGIIISVLLVVAGTVYFFGAGLDEMKVQVNTDAADVLREAQIKTAVADGVALKLFASSSEDALARVRAAEGEAVPAGGAIVIGSDEARMMREENLFKEEGDELQGLFGIDTQVGGVLEPTETILDDMHFVEPAQYSKLDGEEGRVFIKFTPEGVPKVFYRLTEDESMPVPITLSEGDVSAYEQHSIAGVTYYPLLIGSAEAVMMREEKLFENPGDTIQGFFGANVFIAGVLAPTNTSIDMMHITPLGEEGLG